MASMQDMKRRREGIRKIHQMTKAMQLVSTVKFQKARKQEEKTRAYFQSMRDITAFLWAKLDAENNLFLRKIESRIQDVVVITSDRGMAGGYNSHVVHLAEETARSGKETIFYVFGKKGKELLKQKGLHLAEQMPDASEKMAESDKRQAGAEYENAKKIAEELWKRYQEGACGSVWLIYTEFRNAITQVPQKIRLLPPEPGAERQWGPNEEIPKGEILEVSEKEMIPTVLETEPSEEAFLEQLMPVYLAGMLYGAWTEAMASENGARMQAMDLATQNAEEMLTRLVLQYNRIRQGNITRELTEIVAGGES